MLQDLCEAAEPWRQNEFSKKDFKNELWIKLVPFIQQSEILQTTDVVVISGSKSSTQKSATSSSSFPWTPDPITKHIAAIMEKSTDDLIVTAEKYVDETLVPLFIAGQCQEDVVEDYNRNHWQQATTEPCFCCPLLACVEALRELCELPSMASDMQACETQLSVRLRGCGATRLESCMWACTC